MIQIPLSRPDISKHEIDAVNEVLATPYLSMGPKLIEFEKKLAQYLGVKYTVVVNSGTAALHLAMKSIGVMEDDEIITTPFSFIASANCALYINAFPRFIDINREDFNIDPNKITEFIEQDCYVDVNNGFLINKNSKKRVKAILLVHVFGEPCKMDSILQLAKRYSLDVIEDACEALGTEYKNQKVGSFGKVGVVAFYPNKQITTGEGGAILTNDYRIQKLCRSYRNQGRAENDHWLNHERLGYNYRLSDINCALGIAQLDRIKEILSKRENIAKLYHEKLKDSEDINIPDTQLNVKKSWFVYVIQLTEKFSIEDRNEIINGLRAKGIDCRNYFSPIHLQPLYRSMFGYQEGDFPVTEYVSERTIALPFFNSISQNQINHVVFCLKQEIRKINNKHRIILEEIKKGCDLGADLEQTYFLCKSDF